MEIIFPIRFVILALSLGCLSLIVANSLALNFTVICMHKELPSLMTENGGGDLHWEWTVILE
uniref:Candidate secreted effector n=1 Tax=Meloidogyne incognita TaxID=6306 RepID=A0A914L700_MELIC